MVWSIERVPSPIGDLTCVSRDASLAALEFPENGERLRRNLARYGVAPQDLTEREGPIGERLRAYFEGDLDALDAVDVATFGTDFERRVYAELRRIRRGEVVSYSELARRCGSPSAVRAVGATNAKNPISIVVPCHRVIGADGSLTGYAGGLERKRWLLAHERPAM
ncbi:MAG: methylated-DNA--[protein]-cysteine S-methyltransferase [Polyangiaceae bacterium]